MVSPAERTNRFKETGFLVGKAPSVGEEYRAYCPSCENPETSKSPSASFNFKKNTFYCQKCGKTFPYEDLWKMARKKLAKNNSKKPKEEDSSSEETLPSPSQLKVWRDDLRRVPGCLNDLKSHRGLSDDTIAKYGLGYSR